MSCRDLTTNSKELVSPYTHDDAENSFKILFFGLTTFGENPLPSYVIVSVPFYKSLSEKDGFTIFENSLLLETTGVQLLVYKLTFVCSNIH